MGLFSHYAVTASAVHGVADAIDKSDKPVASVRGSVLSAHAHAVAAASGSLKPPLSSSDQQVVASAENILQDASFSAGCVRYWGDAIEVYNSSVDKLNERYDTASSTNFGLTGPSLWDYLANGKLDQYPDALTTFHQQVSAARSSLVAQLTREEHTLHGTLDGEATKSAGWLNAGKSDAVVLALVRSGAMPLVAIDYFSGTDFSSIDMAALRRTLAALGRSGYFDPSQFPTAADAKRLLELMRQNGVIPSEYGPLLQRYLLLGSCEKAGIYLDGWDPTKGADANLSNLIASYQYYGQLFLNNPNFQWAGMAGMIGPTFAGGMFDLELLRKLSDIASKPLDSVPGWLIGPLMPSQLRDLSLIGTLSEGEFKYFENSLLSMQKQIFSDQMPMHEAYLESGLAGIKEMYDAGLIDASTYRAWQDIDSDDPSRVAAGNKQLLYREQHDIIGQDYDDMRNYHGPVGQTMTYLMGAIGDPGIPGAQSLGEYDPLEFSGRVQLPSVDTAPVDLPGPIDLPGVHTPSPWGELDVKTPLPEGNISNFETRWDLIEHDTLPAYQKLIAEHPDEVRAILQGAVANRIDDARLYNNIDDLIKRLSDFDVTVKVGVN